METKHSPGPWHIEDEYIFDAILSRVATVDFGDDCEETITGAGRTPQGTGRANARLIAAAPDLLAACKAALRAMINDPLRVTDSDGLATVDTTGLPIEQLEDAIARAERQDHPCAN